MPIERDKVVSFHYTLSQVDGEQLESSSESEPMTYLHGHKNILPALERAIAGRDIGEKLQVTLSPEEAYGPRFENSVERVPIKRVRHRGKLRPGMTIHVESDKGMRPARVVKVGKFNVDVDTNHPLAGLSLSFDIEIVEVREATTEERAHGHAHGAGGHSH